MVSLWVRHWEHLSTNFSVLKFSTENIVDGKHSFLHVMGNNENPSTFKTNVFKRSLYTNVCMDVRCECVERYKRSVITGYLDRAYRICYNEVDLKNEINYIKKMLENNNHSSKMINNEKENFN